MSDKPEFDVDGKSALKEVRTDAEPTDWCLFSYDGPKGAKVILVGKGSGGINELKGLLKDDMVGYGLVRKTDKIDDSVTVKFCFINWVGDNIPRMLRARLPTHSGAVKDFIGQFHVDISANDLNELSDTILQEKIMDTSGSGSRVMDKATGAAQFRTQAQGGAKVGGANASKTSGDKVEFPDEANLKSSINDVRSGNTDWVLMGYESPNSNNVILLGTGNGGVEELKGLLKDDLIAYGLVRRVEQIDDTQATKFAFIKFQGDEIPRMQKARIGTHTGKINEFFHPFHVTLDVTSPSELSDEIVLKTIKNASGTSVHVLADEKTQRTAPIGISKGTTGPAVGRTNTVVAKAPIVPKTLTGNQVIKFIDEESVRSYIKDVRNDSTDTTWCLIGYEGKKGDTLTVLGKGSGGVDELVALLEDDMVGYGLVRKTEKIDESLTVKFVHVVFIGENINRMHRARLGTHKGAITALFAPYHVDVEASHKGELSDDVLMRKIQDNSGTRSKVKE